jgi:flagellar basal body-associated protein FliL
MHSTTTPSGFSSLIRHLAGAVALTFALSVSPSLAADEQPPQQTAQHKTTTSLTYVIIDPIYSTIHDGGKPRGLLMVELGLDVPDAALRADVNRFLPLLRDAYVRSLLTYAATTVRPNRQPNVEDIGNRLQAITDKVMGKQGARVLMTQTAIRITR